jgi:hypothetical protein
MKQYVGLDVSLEQTAVCIVDEHGKALWRGKCASTPEAIAAVIKARAPHVERIGLESGPLSTWHWHELKKRGLPVICLDARHAKAALSLQVNKTDPNDALGLAQIVRTGWYREVTVKSLDSQVIRSFLSSRARLVEVRVDLINQIRGMLKPFGLVAGKGGRQPFIDRVRELVADGPLKDAVEALLTALQEDQPTNRHPLPSPHGTGAPGSGGPTPDDGSRCRLSGRVGLYQCHRHTRPVLELVQRRGLPWPDPTTVSVRRDRPKRSDLQVRRSAPASRLRCINLERSQRIQSNGSFRLQGRTTG